MRSANNTRCAAFSHTIEFYVVIPSGILWLALLIGCASSFSSSTEDKILSESPIVFAHITDTHVGYPPVTEKRLLEVVSQINERRPAFVVHTGDVAHFQCVPEWQKFKEIFSSLHIDCHVIPGNHDTGELPTAESTALWRKHMGTENFSFVESEVAFIGVNLTSFWQSDIEHPEDPARGQEQKKIRREILTWLGNELQKARNCRARFVFGHFPIYLTDLYDDDYQDSISEHKTREQIIEVLLDGRCDAYFCGHTHFGWENDIGLKDKGRLRQVVAASLAYPALVRGCEEHEFLRERRCLGWYLWKYYPDTGKLVKEFIEIGGNVKTIIFNRY